ncbi:hypothetical protein [Cellulosimicrobium arenosum]|uniref:Uncharacterized protein n=1 Tax=Cellulosimicrobium arenosum TaxID=2708133 RepID=A0A927J270_9MICO|nr:hypothetical protein [Cellulosimicrobium arenosum]MBD8080546.1 hypothetical protein [Cellulosimicrobium arenosum]
MTGRAPLLRVLVGFALLGAGIVNLGLSRGTLPATGGLVALGLGTIEIPCALLTLADRRPRRLGAQALGRVAVGLLVVGSITQAALTVLGGQTLGSAVTAVAALQIAGAGTIGVLTRPELGSRPLPARRATTTVGALFVAAVVVATVTTFGLSGTEAAEHAVPHGDHHLPDLPGLHVRHQP